MKDGKDGHISMLNPGRGAENAEPAAGHGRCSICGEDVRFEIEEGFSLREAACPACGSSMRSRDLAKAIVETFCPDSAAPLAESLGCLENLSIYESQACGAIHRCLRGLPHYVCSEYLDGILPGSTDERDMRCEDMEKLTFEDNSFDLVITQDVFEHVKNPYKGFMEARRVLKPGGVHVFTIPFHEGRDTVRRAASEDGEDIFHLPPVYHGDPLREAGSLVYTDFGEDITHRLKSLDFPTRIAIHNKFYPPDAIPRISDEESYKDYIYYRQRGEALKYLLYNSVVFVSEKREDSGRDGLRWTGERYVPWIGGEVIHYEHLHRYRFAKEFVKGKKVLDLGCGEGYGSFMLSEDAGLLVGVDIDPACVRHASSKYSGKNLRFIEGSITSVPLDGRGLYDVIVCFEALEHIKAHDELMDEVKRLLKPDGVFIVSTPDKRAYSDRPDYRNPFHVRELYQDEFLDQFSKRFKSVFLYGQRVEPGSRIFPLFECAIPEREFAIEESGEGFVFSSAGDLTAKYLIAVASDNPDQEMLVGDSRVVDLSDTVIRKMGRYVGELGDALRRKESVIQGQIQEIHKKNDRIFSLESELDQIRRSRLWRLFKLMRRLLRRRV